MNVTETIVLLSLLGACLSLFAPFCASAHECDKRDTRLFGRIPLALVGLIGYGLIAGTAWGVLHGVWPKIMPVAHGALVIFAAFFTIYLVRKATRISFFGCPACVTIWIVNAALVILWWFSIVPRHN